MKYSSKLRLQILFPVVLLTSLLLVFIVLDKRQQTQVENLFVISQVQSSLASVELDYENLRRNIFERVNHAGHSEKQQQLANEGKSKSQEIQQLIQGISERLAFTKTDTSILMQDMRLYTAEFLRVSQLFDTDQAKTAEFERFELLFYTSNKSVKALKNELNAYTNNTVLPALKTIKTIQRNVGVLGMALILVCTFFLMKAIKNITQILGDEPAMIFKLLEKIKHFDFSITPSGSQGSVRWSLGEVVEDLSSFMAAIYDTANEQTRRTGMLRRNFDSTVAGMDEIQKNANVLSSSMQQLTTTVNEVAQNIKLANTNTQQAQLYSSKGVNEATSTIELIKTMAASIELCVLTINELNKKSQQITSILDVIAGISDQTNLLALNAAIEAARAGEAGRGFSVVAEEVRTLASKTNDATKSIRKMIDELNAGTSSAVHNMQQTHEQSVRVVDNTHTLGQALQSIAVTIEQLVNINAQISTAVEHHSIVAAQVADSALQVSAIASDVTGRSRSDLRWVMELNFLSRSAIQLTSRFKLPDVFTKYIKLGEEELDKRSDVIAMWHEGFILKIPSMDHQHKKIFDTINILYKTFSNNGSKAQIMSVINELASISLKHLSDEEQLLKRANYKDFDEHLKTHDALRVEFYAHIKTINTEMSDENLIKFIMFLRNWIIDHIFATDRRYAKSLIIAGIN